jgi:DNA-binding XRE family transcriptional regulator
METPIRALRDKLQMTQGEMAEKLGVAQCTVSAWEHGGAIRPRLAIRVVSKWRRICDGLGITVEKLVRQGRK